MGKRKQKTNKQKSKKKLWLWILAVVVFIVAALVVYWRVDTYVEGVRYEEDHQRFMRVKEDIETLTAELNKVDENIQWKSEATCRRSSVKYQEGIPTCEIRAKALVAVDSDVQAAGYIEKYSQIFTSFDPFRVDGGYETINATPEFPNDLKEGAGGQNFWSDQNHMRCSSLFIIDEKARGQLEMNFSCRDTALDAWFHTPTAREGLNEIAAE